MKALQAARAACSSSGELRWISGMVNLEAHGGAAFATAKAAKYAAQVKTYDDDYWNNKT